MQTNNAQADAPTRYSNESRKMPWNVMGGDLTTGYATVDEAIEATGLDYEVEVRDLASVQYDEDGRLINNSIIQAKNLRTITRPMPDGSTKVLAAAGTRYTPIQNRNAFKVADVLVGEYGAKIAGAADFRSGGASLLVLDLARPVVLDLPNGGTDTVDVDLLIKNAHDGSAALTFALIGMRLACTNAVQAALGNAKRTWKISHTPNADSRVSLARQSIIAAINYQDRLQAQAQAMVDKAMVDAEFDKIVAGMWPVAEGSEDTRTGQRRLAIRDEVKALYHTSPTIEGLRGTRWGGYNAVTEWLDWGRPVNGKDEAAKAVSRAEGALQGPYVRTKAGAWDRFSRGLVTA